MARKTLNTSEEILEYIIDLGGKCDLMDCHGTANGMINSIPCPLQKSISDGSIRWCMHGPTFRHTLESQRATKLQMAQEKLETIRKLKWLDTLT